MTDPSMWNVIIADDDPDSIGVVEYVLTFHGSKVRTANGGAACLEMLRQDRPTILFLDIQMPRMSGWDVIKEIRADTSLKDLLVIALTAHAMTGDRERVLAAGFDAYFSKPISPLTFINDVKAVVASQVESRSSS